MRELDALKSTRIHGLMLCRDWGDRRPWPTGLDGKRPNDLGFMRHKVKEIIRAAGLRDEFTSFRHGGFTEAGDADLTDTEISGHKADTGPPRCCRGTLNEPCGRLR
jgi:hypothetical protein